jgi:glutaryl-CoA dehydrogenase
MGDEWVINGKKRWIGLGTIADVAIVWAKDEEGVVRGFVVPTNTPGYKATAIEKQTLNARFAAKTELEFTDMRVPADAMMPKAKGLSSPFKCLNEARYGIVWGRYGRCSIQYGSHNRPRHRP